MVELMITIGSHFFRINKITPRARQVIENFAKQFVQYGWERRGRQYVRAPLKVFASASANRTEYRFNINTLNKFKIQLKTYSINEDMVEYVTLDVPTPDKVNLKLQPHWKDRDYQVPIIEYIVSDESPTNKFISLNTGMGKAQPLSVKIKIPGGWSTMGEMQVGTNVIAKDGSSSKVIAVHPQGIKQVYTITFRDGRSTQCCGDHLWRIYYGNCQKHLSWRIVTTTEMIRLNNTKDPRVYVELIDPEDHLDSDLPIDPYVLGLILGAGSTNANRIFITKNDEFIFDEIRKVLPPTLSLNLLKRENYSLTYSISRLHGSNVENLYTSILRKLNLMGVLNHEKFIPKEYLEGSYNQRLSVLQGLLDTVGSCSLDGNIEYSSSSKQLALDVQYLVRSLGGMATIHSRTPFYIKEGVKVNCKVNYRMNIRIIYPSRLFRLPRKKERTNDNNQYSNNLVNRVVSIVPSSIEECQCITIDHPDQLYVTDDFIVTHNSFVSMKAASILGFRLLVIVKPMYIEKWVDDIKRTYIIENDSDIMVVRGGAQLMALIELALNKELDSKIIIISSKTIALWIKDWEKHLDYTLEMGYGCSPEDLAKVLGAGVSLIDEAHQEYHSNFKIALYTNIYKTVSLSATLLSDDDFINQMYEIEYPAASRYIGPANAKYISATAVIYRIKNPNKIRCIDGISKSYSHHLFEQSILRSDSMTDNYLKLIKEVFEGSFIANYKEGQRCLIFCISIDMCTIVSDYLKKQYKQFDIRRYCEEDLFENLMVADVCVSTLQSSGTAVDIDKLSTVILTTAVSSTQSNVQSIGRLRPLKDNSTPNFLYFTCEDIPKHLDYHEKKRIILEKTVLNYKSVFINNPI